LAYEGIHQSRFISIRPDDSSNIEHRIQKNTSTAQSVVESIAAGILVVIIFIRVDTATDLSGRPLNLSITVFAVKAAAWLWDAKTKKTETA
jgi:hypothetical protein